MGASKQRGGVSLDKNFYSPQTFKHATFSVQVTLNVVRAFRGCSPGLKCGLQLIGSDCCESEFRMMGGHSGQQTHSCDFYYYHGCRAAAGGCLLSRLYIAEMENGGSLPDRKVRKCEFLHNCQEKRGDPASLREHLSDVDTAEALNLGAEEARAACSRLGMEGPMISTPLCPSQSSSKLPFPC